MKRFIGLILACLVLVVGVFGSPLIFKTTKEIKSDGNISVELATVDVSKYKQIRVGVIQVSGEIHGAGNFINIEAIEETDFIQIGGIRIYTLNFGKSELIENFSNKIRISTKDSGVYKVFVWAQ